MANIQASKGPPGKRRLVMLSVLAAALILAVLWTLMRMLNGSGADSAENSSSRQDFGAGGGLAAMPSAEEQEEAEKQHAKERRMETSAQITAFAHPAEPVAAGRHDDEIKLQKLKTDVNRQLLERLKQCVKDHPDRDNHELERQIKRREKQINPMF
ncbi:MAG: hypothetical protein PHP98_01260 [Kiritimatiellae bacterium]|nr:hypothetical protein [Kiritimatiellia bacterium]